MTKTDLVKSVAHRAGSNRPTSEIFVDAMLDAMKEELLNGGEVTLLGIGKIYVTKAKPKKVMSFQTGEMQVVPERNAVKFKCSELMRKAVNP